MSKVNPPFRADHVGSLLRPPAVHDARAQRRRRRDHAPPSCATVEDAAIAEAVAQARGDSGCAASPTASSGGRGSTSTSSSSSTASPSPATSPPARTPATTVHMTPPKLSVVGPLRHVRDIQVDDFRYLASVATADAEGVDPVADDGPLPRRAGGDRHRRLPRPRASSSPISRRATAPRSTPCTPPAAATSSSTTPTSPTCAIR